MGLVQSFRVSSVGDQGAGRRVRLPVHHAGRRMRRVWWLGLGDVRGSSSP